MSDDSMALGYALGQDSNGGNNNGGGFFGNEGLWAVIILAIIFGGLWGGSSYGNNGGGATQFLPYAIGGSSAATQADIQRGFDTSNTFSKLEGINNGLCDGFYSVNTALLNGFNGVDNAICNLGYTMQGGFNATQMAMMQNQNALSTQLADCCCKTQTNMMQLGNSMERGFCQANYNAATNTTAIIQNAHNDTDRVLAKLDAMEMSRKDETIFALREKLAAADLAASQAAQNNYLISQLRPCPQPAYLTCNPFTGQTYSYGGCNQGCGPCC